MSDVCAVTARAEVRPPWAFRLPRRGGMDGVLRVRGGVVERLLHVDGERVVVRTAQPSASRVLFEARAARRDAAEEGIARMRFALGVDEDLREFHERYRFDPLIGRAVRSDPWLRVRRRPVAFEALAWAITEQLIEFVRAAAIQRRIVRALGRRCPETGLRDAPAPESLAAVAPARLCAWDLGERRALALVRAAREVAAGRIDLEGDHERAWRRLRAIPGIGAWTVEILALHGQGRYDQVPAADVGLLKLVGRMRTGNPRAKGTEEEVRELFARFHPWGGLAAAYFLQAPG